MEKEELEASYRKLIEEHAQLRYKYVSRVQEKEHTYWSVSVLSVFRMNWSSRNAIYNYDCKRWTRLWPKRMKQVVLTLSCEQKSNIWNKICKLKHPCHFWLLSQCQCHCNSQKSEDRRQEAEVLLEQQTMAIEELTQKVKVCVSNDLWLLMMKAFLGRRTEGTGRTNFKTQRSIGWISTCCRKTPKGRKRDWKVQKKVGR